MTKKIKLFKDFTYYSLIKEAIYASPNRLITANDIFNYFVLRYPDLFRQSNSMTWKGNIRQVLSKNPEFVKINKKDYNRLHYWTHKPEEVLIQEEDRLNKCLLNRHETSRTTTNLDRPYDYYSTIATGRCSRKSKENKNENLDFIKKSSIIIKNRNLESTYEMSKNLDAELKNILDLTDDELGGYGMEDQLNEFKDNSQAKNTVEEIQSQYFDNEAFSDSSELQYKPIKEDEIEKCYDQNTEYTYKFKDYINENNKDLLYYSQENISQMATWNNPHEEYNISGTYMEAGFKCPITRNGTYKEAGFGSPKKQGFNLNDEKKKDEGSNSKNVKAIKRKNAGSENTTNKSEKSEYFYDFNEEKVYLKKYPKKDC